MSTLVDPFVRAAPHARRTLWWLVAACLAWAGVSWFSNANLDGYHDMLENYAWAQPLRWGVWPGVCGAAAQRAYHRGPVGPLPMYCSIPVPNGARVYPYAPTLFA